MGGVKSKDEGGAKMKWEGPKVRMEKDEEGWANSSHHMVTWCTLTLSISLACLWEASLILVFRSCSCWLELLTSASDLSRSLRKRAATCADFSSHSCNYMYVIGYSMV